jgi:hypothetical protein
VPTAGEAAVAWALRNTLVFTELRINPFHNRPLTRSIHDQVHRVVWMRVDWWKVFFKLLKKSRYLKSFDLKHT